jgi:outer membrane protein
MQKHSLSRLATMLSFAGTAICLTVAPAQAYETSDVILRAGPALVSPQTSNHTTLDGLDVDSNTQLGLTATWMLHPNIGVELLASTPFKHDITLKGSHIGSTRQLPPTISLQWFPCPSKTVQPYVGIGINHTVFFDTDNVLGADVSLTDSTGVAFEAGIDVQVWDKLIVNASVWKIDINTDVKVNGAKQGELEIDPFAAMLGVAYKF